MSARKPLALTARWNKDLTITLYCQGRKVFRTRKGAHRDPREEIAAFLDGWFGEHPNKVRWIYA